MRRSASRRRVLELTGLSLAAALPGCASVADRLSSDSTAPASNGSAPADSETLGRSSANETAASEPGGDTSDAPVDVRAPDVSFADAPLPDDPDSYPYARMGTGADVTATVFGNWKCPYTRAMVREFLPEIESSFVRTGDLDLEIRFLAYRSGEPFLGADAPRATRAGLTVWDADPEAYWSYLSYAFANQPSEGERWATAETLGRFADAAGVSAPVADRLGGDGSSDRVDRTVAAARERSIHSVPRLVVEGDVFAPTIDPAAARDALASATR